jgi:hypothetical protein
LALRRPERATGEAAMVTEHPMIIREIQDLGLSLPMWGRFSGAELIYAIGVMADGKARCWSREPAETAEVFGARIARDVAERAFAGQCPALLTG